MFIVSRNKLLAFLIYSLMYYRPNLIIELMEKRSTEIKFLCLPKHISSKSSLVELANDFMKHKQSSGGVLNGSYSETLLKT